VHNNLDPMMVAPMVVASCLSLASSFLDFDLESYTELVECYRQGEFLQSARALSERPPEKVREFASEFRTAARSDLDLQTAALLHIEVIRWFGTEEPTHFEIAGLHIASMTDDERRAEFEKKLRLALGYFYYFHLRFADAVAVFEGPLPPPRDWELRYALATLQEAMILTSSGNGSLQAAEMEYRWLLGERPEQAELHIRLGQVLWRLGRVEESLAEIIGHLPKLSEAEAPERLAADLVLGEIQGSRGETEQALAHFRSAYAVDPDCQAASAALGLALAAAGQDAEALAITKRFLESGGHDAFTDDTWWQYILGRALEHRKLFSELQQELRE
jgi:tetratricopeptide (TPR) repeat protein